jgi:hypothetical protein
MLSTKKSIIIILLLSISAMLPAFAAGSGEPDDEGFSIPFIERFARGEKIPLDSAMLNDPVLNEKVIVGGDTIGVVLKQKNYGRYDRGLYNFLFVPKGQWSFGIQASYGEFNTSDFQMLSVISDLDVKVKAYSLQPSIAYFFGNNQSIGVNFNYSRMYLDLSGLTVDFSDDISFSLADISYYSKSYTSSFAYRNYVGLGRDRRFGVFNEVELAFGAGSSRFKRNFDGAPRDTRTNSMTASLNFSPGICVFIMDNVSFNVSFGVFGIKAHHERQVTDGVDEGSRFTSGANFRFNIFNINFGMAVFI